MTERRRPEPRRAASCDDAPPFLTWRAIYLIVLGALAVEIALGAALTRPLSMSALDWVVLFGTLGAIVAYGLWKTRGPSNMADYLHGGYRDHWLTIGLAVMATQASAITFLSMPGQAYEDGMRFVQFYFGLPIAMVVLSVAFVPRFYRLRVLTAYEYPRGALRSARPASSPRSCSCCSAGCRPGSRSTRRRSCSRRCSAGR